MSEKLALTPYDVAVLTAAGHGLVSGVNRAQHPEAAGEPALERGIGQGLTSTLGHLAGALPAAYATSGMGPLASSALATMAGLASGTILPKVTQKATQIGSEMTGGRVRMAAVRALAKAGAGDKTAQFTYDAMDGPPSEITMSAAAQPPPGSIQSMDAGMGSMGFPPPRPKKPKEAPAMKTETKKTETKKTETKKTEAPKAEEKPETKEASGDATTFMSSFMGKWRAASGRPMSEKVALYRGSGFGAAMKRSAA